MRAGAIQAIVHDLRSLLRLLEGRTEQPSAAVFDSRTLRSTPESGAQSGLDLYKKKRGSKTHLAVDTLGHLLGLVVTPASTQGRDAVARLTRAVRVATQETVEVAFVHGVYKGPVAHAAAQCEGIRLEVVTLPGGQRASCCCRAAGWSSAVSPG